MPRKSAARRLKESKDLYESYSAENMETSYQGRFISDVIRKLEAGRGLSKRQRDWIDNLIEEGVPEAKGNPEVLASLTSAIDQWTGNPDRSWELGVVVDFKNRLRGGRDLSEKQSALMEKLLKRSAEDAAGLNIFKPNEEQMADLKALVKLYEGYTQFWRNDRPAVYKAVNRVTRFLEGGTTIELYHYEKLIKAMGSKLRKFKSPRFSTGDLAFMPVYDRETNTSSSAMATALSDAYINDKGHIVNDWFCNGTVITKDQDNVKKRR